MNRLQPKKRQISDMTVNWIMDITKWIQKLFGYVFHPLHSSVYHLLLECFYLKFFCLCQKNPIEVWKSDRVWAKSKFKQIYLIYAQTEIPTIAVTSTKARSNKNARKQFNAEWEIRWNKTIPFHFNWFQRYEEKNT